MANSIHYTTSCWRVVSPVHCWTVKLVTSFRGLACAAGDVALGNTFVSVESDVIDQRWFFCRGNPDNLRKSSAEWRHQSAVHRPHTTALSHCHPSYDNVPTCQDWSLQRSVCGALVCNYLSMDCRQQTPHRCAGRNVARQRLNSTADRMRFSRQQMRGKRSTTEGPFHVGVCLLYDQSLRVRTGQLPIFSTFESVAAIVHCAGFNTVVVVIYRPGSCSVTQLFFDDFSHLLKQLSTSHHHWQSSAI